MRIRFNKLLIVSLVLGATVAMGSPEASQPTETIAASLKRLDLSGTPAGLPAALTPLAFGAKADRSAVARASSEHSVSGGSGAPARIAMPVGDVNGDAVADVFDLRASEGTLTYQVISGRTGVTAWRAAAITRPSVVFASAFAARINDDAATDVYLLEQHEHDARLNWTLHAIDGATGASTWTTAGFLPTGVPSVDTTPPSIPPSVPPLPTVDPSALPSVDPTSIPTIDPSNPPSIDPSALPLPSVDPSSLPSVDPSNLPGLPSEVPDPNELLPDVIPSDLPTTLPSDLPTILPSDDPTTLLPSIPPSQAPGSAQRRSAADESPATTFPFTGYVTGAAAVDVTGDGLTDFPLTQTIAVRTSDQQSTIVVSTLATVNAKDASAIGVATATGTNALPHVSVAGDFMSQGRPGFLAVDEIGGVGGSLVTYRALLGNGVPVWTSSENTTTAGTIASFDARTDLTGDGQADVLAVRTPIVAGDTPTTVSVRNGPVGAEKWRRVLTGEQAVAVVSGALDAEAGADVVVQGLTFSASGTIPSHVAYRGIGGASGTDVYGRKVPVANGGAIGDWSAMLAIDAGKLDADAIHDQYHSVAGVPADGSPTRWSQAAFSAAGGQTLWTRESSVNPGAPIGGNLLGDAAADIVDVQESATRTSDSLVIKASSGSDGALRYSTRVLIGGGTERVRSLQVQPTRPGGASDLLITVIQRSGTQTRSLLVSIRGSTGQVMWIRTI